MSRDAIGQVLFIGGTISLLAGYAIGHEEDKGTQARILIAIGVVAVVPSLFMMNFFKPVNGKVIHE